SSELSFFRVFDELRPQTRSSGEEFIYNVGELRVAVRKLARPMPYSVQRALATRVVLNGKQTSQDEKDFRMELSGFEIPRIFVGQRKHPVVPKKIPPHVAREIERFSFFAMGKMRGASRDHHLFKQRHKRSQGAKTLLERNLVIHQRQREVRGGATHEKPDPLVQLLVGEAGQ